MSNNTGARQWTGRSQQPAIELSTLDQPAGGRRGSLGNTSPVSGGLRPPPTSAGNSPLGNGVSRHMPSLTLDGSCQDHRITSPDGLRFVQIRQSSLHFYETQEDYKSLQPALALLQAGGAQVRPPRGLLRAVCSEEVAARTIVLPTPSRRGLSLLLDWMAHKQWSTSNRCPSEFPSIARQDKGDGHPSQVNPSRPDEADPHPPRKDFVVYADFSPTECQCSRSFPPYEDALITTSPYRTRDE